MDATIRRLTPADAEAFVAIRRRALDAEPFAFTASPADDGGVSLEITRQRLAATDGSATFGAFAPELVGIAGLFRNHQVKAAHIATLWGVYVDAALQGAGIGRRLVETVLGHARTLDGVANVNLSVSEHQAVARRLYERLGFFCWGTEPDAIRWQGRSAAKHHMMLRL